MSPLIPDDGQDLDLDAQLRAYQLAQAQVENAKQVLEWMTWETIEALNRSGIYDPRDIASRLHVKQWDVIRRMLPPAQAQYYSHELDDAAKRRVAEILREAGVDRTAR